MSGAAENRWSRGGPQQQRQNRPQGTPTGSGTNTPNRPPSGNAWAGNNAQLQAQAAGQRRNSPAPAAAKSGPAAGAYTPVRGFNSGEVKDFLAKNYKAAINTGAGDPYMRVQGDSVAKRSSGVWSKNQIDVKNMANGQNFWAQLSVQVQKAEQGK